MVDISIFVNASPDDGTHRSVASHVFNSTTALVQIGFSTGAENLGGFCVFRGVSIPQGATILSAIIRFQADTTQTLNTVNAQIDGELAVDFGTMDHATFDGGSIQGPDHGRQRGNRTVAIVPWSDIEDTVAGNFYDTPDFAAVVREIINQPGWLVGNDLCIYVGDEDEESTQVSNTRRIWESFDDAGTNPELRVTYEVLDIPSPAAFGPAIVKVPDEVVSI